MPSGIYQHKKGREWKVKDSSKMGLYWKGKKNPHSIEWINKIRKKLKGKPSGALGKHWKVKDNHKIGKYCRTKKIKKKMSDAKKGKQSGNWKGGISKLPDYGLKIREKQAGRPKPKQCEICGAFGRIDFDHDHKTGKFRGWICHRCNITLGFVKDSKDLLNMLIDYLNKNYN
jgi:hypothetical protein